MDEVERQVRAAVRFELVDGILEGLPRVENLTGLVFDQTTSLSRRIVPGWSVGATGGFAPRQNLIFRVYG